MLTNALLLAVLVLSLATLVTAHVTLSLRLARRLEPRALALLALGVPPLAPLWGFRHGLRRHAALWLGAVVVYAVARVLAG